MAKYVKEGFNKGNAQFRNAKAAAKAGQCDKIAILQVNNNKALFPMDFIEYALKDMPMVHGAHIYLKVFILLHLCIVIQLKQLFFFIIMDDAGTIAPGLP